MNTPVTSELDQILAHYDLGELVDYKKNERGYVNTGYAIHTHRDGERRRYFLRKYKRGISEEELQFEHSLVEHLSAAGVPVARIHPTRAGSTYLRGDEGTEMAAGVFYTIFDYLTGDDRFTWVNPVLSEAELTASARLLAQFHLATAGFNPRGRRVEPRITELLPLIAESWSSCPGRSKGTVFDQILLERLELVGGNIAATLAALTEPQARSMPELVIHCDFHPGNLKFSGQAVTGLFDFDWSKMDLRAFDLGLALWYFCTSWQGAEDGHLRLEWARSFLRSYLATLANQPKASSLTPQERHYLPVLINAGSLYVLNWTVLDYFSKDVDAQEYRVYLEHSLNFARWYEVSENRRALEALVASCA